MSNILNNKFLQRFFGLASFISGVLIVLCYVLLILESIRELSYPPPEDGDLFIMLLGIIFFVFFVCAISLLSLVYFILHSIKNPNLEQSNNRIVWVLILVLVGGLGNLMYWIIEIEYKDPRPLIK